MRKSDSAGEGFALVVVLAMVVLLTVLALAFFSRATAERQAAAGEVSGVGAIQLAGTAVALVQSLIGLATTETDGANGTGQAYAWASQPGMLRTFESNGSLRHVYKLYPSEEMIAGALNLAADTAPASWATDRAVWTDLNEPAADIAGRMVFPIVDPRAQVEGFRVEAGGPVSPVPGQLPMPVRWLYVLKDGSLVAARGSGGTATVDGATAQNPIVGRVAFWTDDETSKVNVNTASEGTYWDTPRADTDQERSLARFQPAKNEFQAYPGHPATTSLRVAFPGLTPQALFALAPRVVEGGSLGGTSIAAGPVDVAGSAQRLFATVDELALQPTREPSALGVQEVDAARFFVTARSRAPELNLFGYPRIAVWPVYRLSTAGAPVLDRTTAFDRLIAFCSTTRADRAYPYFFQRQNSRSTTVDIGIPRNQDLFRYLQALTSLPHPGFGGNFLAKFGPDRDQILLQIFDYVRSVNLSDSSLANNRRFTAGRTEAWAPGSAPGMEQGHGWVVPSQWGAGEARVQGLGRALTLAELVVGFLCNAAADDPATTEVDESAGSNTVSNPNLEGTPLAEGEQMIQAVVAPAFFAVMKGWVGLRPRLRMRIEGLETFAVRVGGQTYPLEFGNASASVDFTQPVGRLFHGRDFGGAVNYRYFAQNQWSYPWVTKPLRVDVSTAGGVMELVGGRLTITLRSMDTGQIYQTVILDVPDAAMPLPKIVDVAIPGYSQAPYSTTPRTKEEFWQFLQVEETPGRLNFTSDPPFEFKDGVPTLLTGALFYPEYDSVRAVAVSHGDYRLVAGLAEVPAGVFVPHPDWNNSSDTPAGRIAALLGNPLDSQFDPRQDEGRRYFAGLDVGVGRRPLILPGAVETPEATGDYDTGLAGHIDGPFVNKPDEGNTFRLEPGAVPYFTHNERQDFSHEAFFSPNRIMPGPGMFGSLPTGVKRGLPWQTLLLRPQPGHPNYSPAVPDHLLLDLFWMPVVEPYAVSENFSTAGKVNMNYQLMPFTHVRRATGMHAVLASEKVAAISDADAAIYKVGAGSRQYRLPIHAEETLRQFDDIFAAGGIFRSATEICDQFIVPEGRTLSEMGTFWSTHRLTGDNLRERIYATLYPRLTTKSNTYTVHVRAQVLKRPLRGNPGEWVEDQDPVLGEYRGFATIERFLPVEMVGESAYRDAASNAEALAGTDAPPPLDAAYRWRVVESRPFAP